MNKDNKNKKETANLQDRNPTERNIYPTNNNDNVYDIAYIVMKNVPYDITQK